MPVSLPHPPCLPCGQSSLLGAPEPFGPSAVPGLGCHLPYLPLRLRGSRRAGCPLGASSLGGSGRKQDRAGKKNFAVRPDPRPAGQPQAEPWGKQCSSLSESRLVTEQRLLQVGRDGGLTQGASVQVRQNLMALMGMGCLPTTPLGLKASSPSTGEVTAIPRHPARPRGSSEFPIQGQTGPYTYEPQHWVKNHSSCSTLNRAT